MPRNREFSEDDVLHAAMNCFWQYGYTIGVRTLERATGLSAPRLYNAFGSKEGLFERALTRYVDKIVRRRVARYLNEDDPLEGIREFGVSACESWATDRAWGCLLTNSFPQLPEHSEPVQDILREGQRVIDDALTDSVRRAQELGQISDTRTPEELAAMLSLMITGLICRARAGEVSDNRSKDAAVRSIMLVVEG